MTLRSSGTLHLDNRTTALSDRVSDTLPLTLRRSTVTLDGHPSMPVSESVGVLAFAGANRIEVNQPGSAPTELFFNGIDRIDRGTVSFGVSNRVPAVAPGRAGIHGVTMVHGILGGWATVGTDWATLDEADRVVALSAYTADVVQPSLNEHLRVTTDTNGGGNLARLSLNLTNSSSAGAALQQGGHTLTLATGALLSGGAGPWTVSGGRVELSPEAEPELIVTTQTDLLLASDIVEVQPGLALTKSGEASLILSGTNTLSGPITLNTGVLAAGSSHALGQSSVLKLNGGTFRALGDLSVPFGVASDSGGQGTFDTQGFTVICEGSASGTFSKTGAGTLSFPTMDSSAIVTPVEGLLRVDNATGGTVQIGGGAIDVTGTIDLLQYNPGQSSKAIRILIGQGIAETLMVEDVSISGSLSFIVDFDLGAEEQDLWLGDIDFDMTFRFHDLGGAETGVNYKLIDAAFDLPFASTFTIDPTSMTEGWAGTFHIDGEGDLAISFTSVPEPSLVGSLVVGMMILWGTRRRIHPHLT